MRVGIDVRCFAGGKTTGVEQYTRSLLCEVFKQTQKQNITKPKEKQIRFVLFFNAYKDIDVDFSWALEYPHIEIKKFQYSNKILNMSLWYFKKPLIDNLLGGVDIFYMPNANFVALSNRAKLITTIHDLSYEHFKNTFSFKRNLWHWLVNPRRLAQKADTICTVSHSSKQDILASYRVDEAKIHVIPGGHDKTQNTLTRNSSALIEVKDHYKLPRKFILYFGTIEPRKNIEGLVRAYSTLRSNNPHIDHKLILAGTKGWNMQKIESAISSSLFTNDIQIYNDVPSRDREAFYILGEVFVYPSHFEGFGFPPLEALSSQKPVITSHTTSLPEVVRDRAIMIDPTRPEEIYQALFEVLTSKDLQQELTNSTDFEKYLNSHSWSTSASHLIQILKQYNG